MKVSPASIKLINPIQNYSHIVESNACILKIFVFMFLLCKALRSGAGRKRDKGRSINFIIYFGISSALKLSK